MRGAWLCLAGAAGTLALALLPGGPWALRVCAVAACLWLLPGWAACRASGRFPRDPAGALAWSFAGSVLWLATAACACYALRLPPHSLVFLNAAFLGAAALLQGRGAGPAAPPRLAEGCLQAGLILGVGAFVLHTGGVLGRGHDALDHLAYMKSILAHQDVLPRAEFYREVTSRAIDLRKGFLHAPLAVSSLLSGGSAADFLAAWPAFVTPCLAACFYVLARSFTDSPWRAGVCAALFLVFYGGPGHAFLVGSAYPNKSAEALLWLAWAEVVRGARGQAPGPLPAPALLVGASMVHVFGAVPWFVSVAAFAATGFLVPGMRAAAGRALRTWGIALLACTPLLAWRFLVSYDPVNPMHTQAEGYLMLRRGFVLDPFVFGSIAGTCTWLGLLASAALLRERPSADRLLLAAALWLPAFVFFNPWLMPVLAPRMSYLLIRLFPAVLAVCATGLGVSALAARVFRGGMGGRVVAAAALAVACLVAMPDLRSAAAGYGAGVAAEKAHSHLQWRPALQWLGRLQGPPRVVVSDPVSEYAIAGLTQHDVVATLNQHASPSDSEAVERMQAALDIMNPGAGPALTGRLLERYGVDYVVVNHTFPHASVDFMASMEPGDFPAIERKFAAHPEVFREVFRDSGQWVYAVDRAALPAYERLPDVAWPEVRPASGRRLGLGYGMQMADAELVPDDVEGGTAIDLRCLMRRDAPLPEMTHLIAVVSLSQAFEGGPKWLPSRLRRLYVERGIHRKLRLNYWVPLRASGAAPEYWPEGRWVEARVPLYIPTGARPGAFALRARLTAQFFAPNSDVRDYLEDDPGATPGGVLDTLRVRAPGPPDGGAHVAG